MDFCWEVGKFCLTTPLLKLLLLLLEETFLMSSEVDNCLSFDSHSLNCVSRRVLDIKYENNPTSVRLSPITD